MLPGEGPGQAQGTYAVKGLLGKADHSDRKYYYPTGDPLRLCRSIQAEGAFALLKNDFGFRRLLATGRNNVCTVIFFLALDFDLKKLWMKRKHGRLQTRASEKMTTQMTDN